MRMLCDPGRVLAAGELVPYALELAEHPAWRALVRHDPASRTYQPLVMGEHVTAWLICWMPGHDTGFHDHDGTSGAVVVVEGAVREQRLRLAEEPCSRVITAGGSFTFDAADIHRVAHSGRAPATTIHVYSPALKGMGAYLADAEGRLQRWPLGEDEELRPDLAVAAGRR